PPPRGLGPGHGHPPRAHAGAPGNAPPPPPPRPPALPPLACPPWPVSPGLSRLACLPWPVSPGLSRLACLASPISPLPPTAEGMRAWTRLDLCGALGAGLVERFEHLGRRHGHLAEPHPGGVGDGSAPRAHRRRARRVVHAAHSVGRAGVGTLHDHGADHRQVRGHGPAVVGEAWVLQLAVVAVDVLLVEGPADALRHAALVLAFDVAW